MKEFVRRHETHIHGVLSCFDRMLFRGYLPIMSGWSMAQFLKDLNPRRAIQRHSSSHAAHLCEHRPRRPVSAGTEPFWIYVSSRLQQIEAPRRCAHSRRCVRMRSITAGS